MHILTVVMFLMVLIVLMQKNLMDDVRISVDSPELFALCLCQEELEGLMVHRS